MPRGRSVWLLDTFDITALGTGTNLDCCLTALGTWSTLTSFGLFVSDLPHLVCWAYPQSSRRTHVSAILSRELSTISPLTRPHQKSEQRLRNFPQLRIMAIMVASQALWILFENSWITKRLGSSANISATYSRNKTKATDGLLTTTICFGAKRAVLKIPRK